MIPVKGLTTVVDPPTRTELDVQCEAGDVQDVPDVLRDEEENARQQGEGVSHDETRDQQASTTKIVIQAPKKR